MWGERSGESPSLLLPHLVRSSWVCISRNQPGLGEEGKELDGLSRTWLSSSPRPCSPSPISLPARPVPRPGSASARGRPLRSLRQILCVAGACGGSSVSVHSSDLSGCPCHLCYMDPVPGRSDAHPGSD